MTRIVIAFLFLVTAVARGANLGEPLVFTGTCDASAASALSDDLFVVANDEDNLLRFYRISQPGKPVQTIDLRPVLALKGKGEMDLEGAARLGQHVFFISSHGRDKDGKLAPGRHRFFALEFAEAGGQTSVQLAGKPYLRLAEDLANDPRYAKFHLNDPASDFNIEALTDTPAGTLLIGFRSPVPQGRALLVPLLNPKEVIAGKAPGFGDPLLLDLGGLGLRGIASTEKGYHILGGPADGPGDSRLFFSAGGPDAPRPVEDIQFPKSNPEGICFVDLDGSVAEFLILSDDGSRKLKGKECRSLPEAQRQFRVYRFKP